MDLDQLIRDADPARSLDVEPPDPSSITSRRRAGGWLPAVAALAVVIAVAAAVLGVRGARSPQRAATPAYLPFGAPWSQPGPTGVLKPTARLVATYPDPAGGPAWGLLTYRTRSEMTCLQVGRTESGRVGAISRGLFHPFAYGDLGLGTCVPDDAHGHAFVNVAAPRTPAGAAQEPCPDGPPPIQRIRRMVSRLYAYCAHAHLRNLYFGLLGPEAMHITFVGGSRPLGPDGAYVIVRATGRETCPKLALGLRVVGGCGGSGIQTGPTLTPGEITAVSYADGRACRLPAPIGDWVPIGAREPGGRLRIYQCSTVGYAAPSMPRYTPAQVAAPVTVRELPARHYCAHRGIDRPNALWIPCDGLVPPGYQRIEGVGLLVYISWTAHAPVRNVNDSAYTFFVQAPCGGGQGGGTEALIRTGQRVTRFLNVDPRCRGTYRGAVRYIARLGPGGEDSMAYGPGTTGLLVGRFSFRGR